MIKVIYFFFKKSLSNFLIPFFLGTLKITGMADCLEKSGIKVLGDGGYQHGNVMVPNDYQHEERKTQNFLRGVVEIFFGLLGSFAAATKRFRGSPSEQAICLGIIYELSARFIGKYPIRAQLQHLGSTLPKSCGPIATASELAALNHILSK
jgi:hypothetical protein